MTLRIWMVRHGETASNREGVFQGHLDVALNPLGEAQASQVARHLAEVGFDAIYASDLQRAARTAEILAEPHGLPVIFDPDLREQHYGVLQGQRYGDAPEVLAGHGLAEAWHRGEFSVRGRAVPGGESARKMRIRALRFVQRLDADYRPGDGRNVLIVSHGGQLRVLLTVLLGLPAPSRHHFAFSNCGVSRVARTHERTVLELLNAVYWTVTDTVSSHAQHDRPPRRGE